MRTMREITRAVLAQPGFTAVPVCGHCGRQIPVAELAGHLAGHEALAREFRMQPECSGCGSCTNPASEAIGDHCPKCCPCGLPF